MRYGTHFKNEYKMTFTTEQLQTLFQWEEHFRTAVRAKWARNPGRSALRTIYDIYTAATGDKRRFSDNCSTCILSLLTDCGNAYFADIAEKAVTNTRVEVKVSQEAKEVVKRTRIKTTKKSK